MLPLSLLTVTDDETGIVYYLPLEADFEDPIDLEYPLLATSGTESPPDQPPPYRSDNETGDLIFSGRRRRWRNGKDIVCGFKKGTNGADVLMQTLPSSMVN